MYLKTCLLITDDPDDHQAFIEAISEISKNTVPIVVSDSEKAFNLVTTKRHVPDYIFLDLTMNGVNDIEFFNTLNDDLNLSTIPVIAYGDENQFSKIKNFEKSSFFKKDYEYSELVGFLKKIIKS